MHNIQNFKILLSEASLKNFYHILWGSVSKLPGSVGKMWQIQILVIYQTIVAILHYIESPTVIVNSQVDLDENYQPRKD